MQLVHQLWLANFEFLPTAKPTNARIEPRLALVARQVLVLVLLLRILQHLVFQQVGNLDKVNELIELRSVFE